MESQTLWGSFLEEVTFELGPEGRVGGFQGLASTENHMSTDLAVGKGLHQPGN